LGRQRRAERPKLAGESLHLVDRLYGSPGIGLFARFGGVKEDQSETSQLIEQASATSWCRFGEAVHALIVAASGVGRNGEAASRARHTPRRALRAL